MAKCERFAPNTVMLISSNYNNGRGVFKIVENLGALSVWFLNSIEEDEQYSR